ncbi:hypothetical protein GOBAR_AA17264 [Gossypium barbadense]|uniref:Uncharacterized protein n=1 Tax=Gossypium barbadense TaxID=3634 RepID=A0A2P5XJA3_GOSBA|nr:hypothetical protein GOBAR_AA17264 [Gossypium barbadense]
MSFPSLLSVSSSGVKTTSSASGGSPGVLITWLISYLVKDCQFISAVASMVFCRASASRECQKEVFRASEERLSVLCAEVSKLAEEHQTRTCERAATRERSDNYLRRFSEREKRGASNFYRLTKLRLSRLDTSSCEHLRIAALYTSLQRALSIFPSKEFIFRHYYPVWLLVDSLVMTPFGLARRTTTVCIAAALDENVPDYKNAAFHTNSTPQQRARIVQPWESSLTADSMSDDI